MKPVDALFGIGSVAALAAGIAEIHSAREKWKNNESRNALTPFFMMCVKALRIPKFAVLARAGGAEAFPLISAACAFLIWTIAWYYNISKSPAAASDHAPAGHPQPSTAHGGRVPVHHPGVSPTHHSSLPPPHHPVHPSRQAHPTGHPGRGRNVAPPGLSMGSFDSSIASASG